MVVLLVLVHRKARHIGPTRHPTAITAVRMNRLRRRIWGRGMARGSFFRESVKHVLIVRGGIVSVGACEPAANQNHEPHGPGRFAQFFLVIPEQIGQEVHLDRFDSVSNRHGEALRAPVCNLSSLLFFEVKETFLLNGLAKGHQLVLRDLEGSSRRTPRIPKRQFGLACRVHAQVPRGSLEAATWLAEIVIGRSSGLVTTSNAADTNNILIMILNSFLLTPKRRWAQFSLDLLLRYRAGRSRVTVPSSHSVTLVQPDGPQTMMVRSGIDLQVARPTAHPTCRLGRLGPRPGARPGS